MGEQSSCSKLGIRVLDVETQIRSLGAIEINKKLDNMGINGQGMKGDHSLPQNKVMMNVNSSNNSTNTHLLVDHDQENKIRSKRRIKG